MSYPIDDIKHYCLKQLDFDRHNFDFEAYSCLPLCAVDMVFGVGITYDIVRNTVERACKNLNIIKKPNSSARPPSVEEQVSVSEFLDKIKGYSTKDLAGQIYGNKLMTSARSGILRAEATTLFLKVLKAYGIEYFQDVHKISMNVAFEEAVAQIKGQSKGSGLRHFLMLSAPPDFVKPDKTTVRFLYRAVEEKYSLEECRQVLYELTSALQADYPNLTPIQLDYMIFYHHKNNMY